MNEDQLRRLFEENDAVLFRQLSKHLGKQITGLRTELKKDHDRTYKAVDGVAKRIDTGEAERAALGHQLNRHHKWIGQLAKATHTKLVPEQ
jgi:hypothetical protein